MIAEKNENKEKVRYKVVWSFLLLLLAMVVYSCELKTGVEQKERRLNMLEVKIDTVARLPLPEGAAKDWRNNYQPYASSLCYGLNKTNGQLSAVDLDDLKVWNVCQLTSPVNYTSFVVDEKGQKILVFLDDYLLEYTFNGTVLDTIVLNENAEAGLMSIQSDYFLPVRTGKKLFMHYFSTKHPKTYKDPQFFKAPIEATLNIENHNVEALEVTYPVSYSEHCFGYDFAPDRAVLKENTFMYTFHQNDTAFVYNVETKKHEEHYLGSNLEHNFIHIDYKEIEDLNSMIFSEMLLKSDKYHFTEVLPNSELIARTMLRYDSITNGLKMNLVLYNLGFDYIGESNFAFNYGPVSDSNHGLSFLTVDKPAEEASELIICRAKWE